MIKVKPDDCEVFEGFIREAAALKEMHRAFIEAVQEKHAALNDRSIKFWEDFKNRYGLEGDFSYSQGRVHPLGLGPDGRKIVMTHPDADAHAVKVAADVNSAIAGSSPFPGMPQINPGSSPEVEPQAGKTVPSIAKRKTN